MSTISRFFKISKLFLQTVKFITYYLFNYISTYDVIITNWFIYLFNLKQTDQIPMHHAS